MGMEGTFNIAAEQKRNGMTQAAAGAPGKAQEL
jgi:hypothetical protein